MTRAPSLSLPELKALLQQQLPGLLYELVPGLRREGAVFSAPNPTRAADAHGSFKVWPSGAWREHDDADCAGDLLDLVAYVNNFAPKTKAARKFAADWARKRLGLADDDLRVVGDAKRKARETAARLARERAAADAAAARKKFLRALAIWGEARAYDTRLVAAYLATRGLGDAAVPRNVRLHGRLDHWAMPHGALWRGPAMVARVVGPQGLCGVHCTWLADDGIGLPGEKGRPPKGVMPNAKLMLGAVKGGVVPIADGLLADGTAAPGLVEGSLAGLARPVILAEGIETAIALSIAVPEARVWACLSLSNIGNAPVDLACVSEIVVALENDTKEPALRARGAALDKLAASGKPVDDDGAAGGGQRFRGCDGGVDVMELERLKDAGRLLSELVAYQAADMGLDFAKDEGEPALFWVGCRAFDHANEDVSITDVIDALAGFVRTNPTAPAEALYRYAHGQQIHAAAPDAFGTVDFKYRLAYEVFSAVLLATDAIVARQIAALEAQAVADAPPAYASAHDLPIEDTILERQPHLLDKVSYAPKGGSDGRLVETNDQGQQGAEAGGNQGEKADASAPQAEGGEGDAPTPVTQAVVDGNQKAVEQAKGDAS